MSADPDRLYNLLPAVYRASDAEQGWPLRGLLQIITEQVNLIEEDIDQLYENWFIETCQSWVVSYIGDVVGYQALLDTSESGDLSSPHGRLRNKILVPRREVANTIRYRRRKGTLSMVELLANAVSGWPALAVEFYRVLGVTQSINHVHMDRGRSADLRESGLDILEGPFNQLAHSLDVRRIPSNRTTGRYNIPSVGLFLWRLKAYPVSHGRAKETVNAHSYAFSALGNDTPLFTPASPEIRPNHSSERPNVPEPIKRGPFESRKKVGRTVQRSASSDYYGPGASVIIWAPGWPTKDSPQPIPATSVLPADLSEWLYRAPRDRVLVDPELGRIVFPSAQEPNKGVWVSYYYGFSADIGSGEYARSLSRQPEEKFYFVSEAGEGGSFKRISDALVQWQKDGIEKAVIEIIDNGEYFEQIDITLAENRSLQIRAANRKRPIIRVFDRDHRPDTWKVTGEGGGWFTINGLLITGGGMGITGKLAGVCIRHSSLVPGWGLQFGCDPEEPSEPSLVLRNLATCVRVEHSILGSIQVSGNQVREDPTKIVITDSILDATSTDEEALCGPEDMIAYVRLTIARSTVIGRVCVHLLELAENTIFYGLVRVARRQAGCLRFCYITPGSRVPRRYNCQPDLAEQFVEHQFRALSPPPSTEEVAAARERERERVRPRFNSLRYGQPMYCQLANFCAEEISSGADDESEMGVFHDLFGPLRKANLETRLEEYSPAGTDAGIVWVT